MKLDDKNEVTYRDTLSTIDDHGKRIWIHAKKPKGKLYNYRQLFGYSLLAFLFIVPFIKVHGEPLLLFNILERKFIIFGSIFWPQDSFIFYLMMLSSILFIILFTVVYGRLFCGWACPQTIFLELIFRKVEWLIDGTPAQQKKLKAQAWNATKIFKRILKHVLFWLISLILVLALLSFVISVNGVFEFISNPSNNPKGIIVLFVFTSAFYFIYGWFREQVCTIMCPYGRLQGVLLDSNSIIVSYDYFRGEPKGVPKKGEENKYGDCIDCKQCVNVCPTGIDIRNGTQLECVNCTACIDACNATMTKIGKPKGLIRFASENGIKNGQKLKLTPRNIAYSVVLGIILIFLTILLFTRPDIETNILRDKNFIYQEQGDTAISNIYNVRILNKTHNTMDLTIKLVSIDGELKFFGDNLQIKSGEKTEPKMIVYIPKDKITQKNMILKFEIYSGNKLLEEVETNFVGPDIN